MIVNHTAMAQLFGRTVSQYDKLRKRNAFLEQYRREPMFADGLEEFDSARFVILQAMCICFSFCSITDREWPYLSAATVSTCALLFLFFSLILLQFCFSHLILQKERSRHSPVLPPHSLFFALIQSAVNALYPT